jgi:histidine ammonia-lyase
MAANVALKAYTILPRLAEVVAIELAFAYQAAAIRKYAPVIPSRAPKDNAKRTERCSPKFARCVCPDPRDA